MSVKIFWFRQDLRLSDNPGLVEAVKEGRVLPVYILDDEAPGRYKMGAASRVWLYHSLIQLNNSLKNTLNVYSGKSEDVLKKIVQDNHVTGIYWNRCYEPWRIACDSAIKKDFKQHMGIESHSYNGSLLWEPWEVLKHDKTPYKVFTPFYQRGCLSAPVPRMPLPASEKASFIKDPHNHLTIKDLDLLPSVGWYSEIESLWQIGEKAAQSRLKLFLENNLNGYKEGRNFPDRSNVSRLSSYIHFGEISPNQIWHAVQTVAPGQDRDVFLSELGWREFSHYLLYHFPDLPFKNFHTKFDRFPWENNQKFLKAWQKGQTGIPIVDAGMRELWHTGYMHNRVRMIVASFLTKNLLIHWHHGADWFWDCLVDADLASNSASWQWVAGSGADAAPYFRIFNPILQGEKFDHDGTYTRRFVPELALLPNKFLFKPWQAPSSLLTEAGIILGKTYPNPIVDLDKSRSKALKVYKSIS